MYVCVSECMYECVHMRVCICMYLWGYIRALIISLVCLRKAGFVLKADNHLLKTFVSLNGVTHFQILRPDDTSKLTIYIYIYIYIYMG